MIDVNDELHPTHYLCIESLIRGIGDDPTRPGLKDTPERVVRSWQELFAGYRQNPKDVFKVFDEPCDEMVIIRNVKFWSMCEHHMLPFYGVAHIAYLPDNGKVIGASKLPRLLEIFARRLQIQERITQQVTKELMGNLQPKGAACVLEATHLCMVMRGVNKQDSDMVTSSMLGAFHEDPKTRAEFLQFIRS